MPNQGLGSDPLLQFRVGGVTRVPHLLPEPGLLPYGCEVGEVRGLELQLGGREQGEVDSLPLAALVPCSIVQRYLGLLKEPRRLVISGPPATGKSSLARGLAALVTRGEVSTVSRAPGVGGQQVAATLGQVQQIRPEVAVVDNLHLAPDLEQALGQVTAAATCSLATLTQTSGFTTDLQLRTNFRWILLAHHVEPVRGYPGGYLRRRLLSVEVETRSHNSEASEVDGWEDGGGGPTDRQQRVTVSDRPPSPSCQLVTSWV